VAEWALGYNPQKSWLPFVDAYRTMCVSPEPEFLRILEEIKHLEFATR
jgi:hypothetical protein